MLDELNFTLEPEESTAQAVSEQKIIEAVEAPDVEVAMLAAEREVEQEFDTSGEVALEAIATLTEKIGAISLKPTLEETYALEKAAYIKLKTEPTDQKERARLEQQLAPTFTEHMLNTAKMREKSGIIELAMPEGKTLSKKAKKAKNNKFIAHPHVPPDLITRESKLAAYVQTLGQEFDELKRLQYKEELIVAKYVEENFKPTKVVAGWLETEEARSAREIKMNVKLREKFIRDHRQPILLDALKVEIRKHSDNTPVKIKSLDKEEKAQIILSPLYQMRIAERYQEVAKIKKDRGNVRYYAKPPVIPAKHITNDAPVLNDLVGMHYRTQLLQRELAKQDPATPLTATERQKRQQLIFSNQGKSDKASEVNRNVTDGRVLDRRSKKFTPLV